MTRAARGRSADGLPCRFGMGALATWRLTHLIAAEDGPVDTIVRLRAKAGEGILGEAMDCFLCLSMWVSLPVAAAVARRPRDLPVLWLALSGAACLLEQATSTDDHSTRGGVGDGLLWPETEGVR